MEPATGTGALLTILRRIDGKILVRFVSSPYNLDVQSLWTCSPHLFWGPILSNLFTTLAF